MASPKRHLQLITDRTGGSPLEPPNKKKRRKAPAGVVIKNKRWYVRVRYTVGGKRSAVWRECAPNATDAKDTRLALQVELRERGHDFAGHANMTFLELATYFENTYLQPAKFIAGRLVSGRRSLIPVKCALKVLKEHFGNKKIRSITHGNLEAMKRVRLDAPIIFKREDKETGQTIITKQQRSISSVQKELALARRMFNVAVREGWLPQNAFARGDSLISPADEAKRERILTREEEQRLLALCVGARAHLRPLIICAVDTGMRWGEMNKLRAGDLDFETRVITIEATHTKTLTRRRVKMTTRVAAELHELAIGKQPTERIFTQGAVKTAWTNVRKAAGLEDLRWHDLRHTNATRIEKSKRVSAGQLQRHLGHADRRSTERYVNQDDEAVIEIAEALEHG